MLGNPGSIEPNAFAPSDELQRLSVEISPRSAPLLRISEIVEIAKRQLFLHEHLRVQTIRWRERPNTDDNVPISPSAQIRVMRGNPRPARAAAQIVATRADSGVRNQYEIPFSAAYFHRRCMPDELLCLQINENKVLTPRISPVLPPDRGTPAE